MSKTTQMYADAAKAIALAAGASVTANIRCDDAFFVVERMQNVVQLNAALISHIAGTTLGASAPPVATTAINDPNANQVLVSIKLEQLQITNDDLPLPAFAFCPDKDGWLRTPMVIPPRATLAVKFTNNAPVALDCRLCLIGYKTNTDPGDNA